MTSRSSTPHGHPLAAAAVVGSFTCALILVMRAGGLLAPLDSGLASGYAAMGFGVGPGAVQPVWAVPLAALLVYAVVWLVLETPGTGRRVLLVGTVLVLTAALSPVLALWGLFWSPVSAVAGVAWGGLCAVLWARQHRMPCEFPVSQELRGGKIIPMQSSVQEGRGSKSAGENVGKAGGTRRRK